MSAFDFMSASAEDKIAHLEARLNAVLQPQSVHIDDDSAAHAGHAGSRSGGHYRVTLVSAAFRGRSRLERHRQVYAAVAPLLSGGIHALNIVARDPDEAR